MLLFVHTLVVATSKNLLPFFVLLDGLLRTRRRYLGWKVKIAMFLLQVG